MKVLTHLVHKCPIWMKLYWTKNKLKAITFLLLKKTTDKSQHSQHGYIKQGIHAETHTKKALCSSERTSRTQIKIYRYWGGGCGVNPIYFID